MTGRLRILLLQIRNPDDPMRVQEVRAFARALQRDVDEIEVHDLLSCGLATRTLESSDLILVGGSGHYSAAGEGEWLDRALDTFREIHAQGVPTFASCWGFQAVARALGGRVIRDPDHAELGTHTLELTAAGRSDPVFEPLGSSFDAQMGHEDRVVELPRGATLLASTSLVENQAYRFDGLPFYCTQFHPEMNQSDLAGRVAVYPEYVERITGVSMEEFLPTVRETPESEALLCRFVNEFVL